MIALGYSLFWPEAMQRYGRFWGYGDIANWAVSSGFNPNQKSGGWASVACSAFGYATL